MQKKKHRKFEISKPEQVLKEKTLTLVYKDRLRDSPTNETCFYIHWG